MLAAAVAAVPAAAGAARAGSAGAAVGTSQGVTIDVVELSGLIDPVLVDFTVRALGAAERSGSAALVVRIDSPGAVVTQSELDALAFRLSHASVPVAAWVGPGRQARAYGGAFQLLQAAAVSGVAPGARVGRSPAPLLGRPNALGNRTVGADEAVRDGVVDVGAATLGDFVVALDGRRVGERTLSVPTTVVSRPGRPPQRALAPEVAVRFGEPAFMAQVLHAVATPAVAYLLLLVGLLCILFEYFTGGVGVVGGVGATTLVLSSYGLAVLPTRPAGLLLVAVAVVGGGIDVQAGAPRAWTVIAAVSLLAGSAFLYEGLTVPIPVLVVLWVGAVLFLVGGMPTMVRTRFSTPTIGRESMLGEVGTALADVAPEGLVQVRDAPWRARTHRATPIRVGQSVRVVGIDGLLLEVAPKQPDDASGSQLGS